MINVLINAYAVSPNWGSEPGLGWNWVVSLAKYCNVFVITESEWKSEIERALDGLPQKQNLHFYYNPVSSEIRKMCWNQGDWRFYKYYRRWQNQVLDIAKDIIQNNQIDVIHQLNMIGYREPGSLWKIKDIPFIWGPVGGYGCTTLKYLKNQNLNVRIKATLKNIINSIQGLYYPLSNHAMKRADKVIAANSNVCKYIKKHHRQDVILMNETGCYVNDSLEIDILNHSDEFEILWVGKFDYRKQLELAIRTIFVLSSKYPNVKLNIVGDTKNDEFTRLNKIVNQLGITTNIKWLGKIPNKEVHSMMRRSDVFFFTSIDEGTPHVVLEAIQNSLPVVCFDTCGQGDIVNNRIGIKVSLSNFEDSQKSFADAMSCLIEDRARLINMKQNCSVEQFALSWDKKAKQMIDIYNSAILNFKKK